MAHLKKKVNKNFLRDAIIDVFFDKVNPRVASTKYGVTARSVRDAFSSLDEEHARWKDADLNQLKEDENHKQVYRWASTYANTSIPLGQNFTPWERKEEVFMDLTSTMTKKIYNTRIWPEPYFTQRTA